MRQNGTSATSKSSATASRRGVALVMFVMLVFAFMGMAALCIDLGMASLTQAQMQNAVDSAASEAIATRDFCEERMAANIFRRRFLVPMRVRDVFDDDFVQHPTAPEQDSGGYSAGPILRLTGGLGDANASALIEEPTSSEYTTAESYVDSPLLRFNPSNLQHGDMLSGKYIPAPPGAGANWHAETPISYHRNDFESSATADMFPQVESWRSLAMLVRMRRVTPAGALDNVANVSSAGPAVPLLFGLGSTVHAADDSTSNVRRDGFSVRATAIGSGLPVLSVGTLQFTDDCSQVLGRKWAFVDEQPRAMYGVAPIAIEKSFWMHVLKDFVDGTSNDVDGDGIPDAEYAVLELDHATGRLVVRGTTQFAGRVYFGDSVGCEYGDLTSVGKQLRSDPISPSEVARLKTWLDLTLSTPVNAPPPYDHFPNKGRCYIPIFTSIDGPGGPRDRVVGFVHGTFVENEDFSTMSQLVINLAKGFPNQDEGAIIPGLDQPCAVLVAPENASARVAGELPVLTEAERTLIFRHLLNLTYLNYPEPPVEAPSAWNPSYDWRDIRNGALLAPGLVR